MTMLTTLFLLFSALFKDYIMIGTAMKLIRTTKNIKLSPLAKEIDVSVSYLSEIENNKKQPSLELIEKYANYFGLRSSDILFFSENIDDNTFIGKIQNKGKNIALKLLSIFGEDNEGNPMQTKQNI